MAKKSDASLAIRMVGEEKKELEHIAEVFDLSLSQVVRRALRYYVNAVKASNYKSIL